MVIVVFFSFTFFYRFYIDFFSLSFEIYFLGFRIFLYGFFIKDKVFCLNRTSGYDSFGEDEFCNEFFFFLRKV